VRHLIVLFCLVGLAACSSTPETTQEAARRALVCDSYVIFDMCVKDLGEDGVVDMVYFSDTDEIFMYREGEREAVVAVMPLHRCAVPLNPGMQRVTNRILHRDNITLSEELDITRQLIANYVAAMPEINACNARYEDVAEEDDFNTEDFDWGEE
jgi:hypothetical protein